MTPVAAPEPVLGDARRRDAGPDERPRARRLLGPAGTVGGLALAVTALALRDPHQAGSWGKCPSLTWFGVACPLCGGLRAVNDLAHGHVVAAFWSNALFVSSIPLFAAWWAWLVVMRWRGQAVDWRRPLEQPLVLPMVLVALAVFGVYRNTPWGSAFYP